MNMYQKLENAVNQWPENLFLVRENITYSEFLSQVRARAATLHKAGVKNGDVIGVLVRGATNYKNKFFILLIYFKKIFLFKL